MKALYLTIALIFLLTGCVTDEIVTTHEFKPYIPELPQRLEFKPVEWRVLNVETNAFFALDAKNYENLSVNIVDTTSYIAKLRTILYSLEHTNLTVAVTNKQSASFLSKFFR